MTTASMGEAVSQAQVNGLVEEVLPQGCWSDDDYAEAAVPEYWIVDPGAETITVLGLIGGVYTEHGVYGRGERAGSPTLPGFTVDVGSVFDAATGADSRSRV